MTTNDPHADQPVETGGEPLETAEAAVVLLHGRGATANGMLGLADEIDASRVVYRAPQAASRTWYPNSFMAEIESNEPWLSSALDFVERTVAEAAEAGIPRDRIALVGFSQGACLASEFVARNARRWGGLAALSGGLIGPEGTTFEYEGTLSGAPVFLGCSDVDPHIPVERVHETVEVFENLDGNVTDRIYEGMGHTVNEDEIGAVSDMIADLTE